MRRAHRFPQRLFRWTSLSVCLALVLSIASNIPVQSASNKPRIPVAPALGQSQNGKSKKGDPEPPQPGPPAARLPNLDEVRHRPQIAPRAAAPQESTIRSRRKPLESRRGRTVVDAPPPRMHKAPRKSVARAPLPADSNLVRSHHARKSVPDLGAANSTLTLQDPKLQPVGATASRNWGSYVPNLVIDNNLNTDWIADDFAPQWIQLDLGQLCSVSKVRLLVMQDPAGHTTHQIYGGPTQSNLALLGTLDGNTQSGQWLELSLSASNIQYVRVTTTVSPSWIGWAEIEIYGSPSSGGSGSAYGGTPLTLPGTIEVENYNEGGAEVAYHDTTPGSHGQDYDQPGYLVPLFRQPTDVDIYKSADYNNGYLILSQAGDWMKYTVNVAQTGSYTLQAKTWYWSVPGGAFHIESDGVDVTGSLQIAGGGGDWGYVTRTGVSLTAGQHVLRLVCDTNGSGGYTGDIDDIKFIGTADQFVQTAHQSSLSRSPQANEASYWSDITRAAFAQGAGSLSLGMRELGMTLFESAAYAARNRSDHDYVYDLYKTYLMREPDPAGWLFWTGQVPADKMGREGVRHAFDDCEEFHRIVSTLTTSGSPPSAVSSLATAQVDLFNVSGNQLRTRDCEWSVPLLTLPGRAGLDLGLGLSYSSQVWTRSGPYTYFDEDIGSPSPGFRLGFPTIRGSYFDAQLKRNVYVLNTAAGVRVELRQLGTSNIYESADSSYLQLTAGSGLQLRTTDGTQMTFAAFEDEWHCTQIEDRNGNLINASYHNGDLTHVVDTVGRDIVFNYDSSGNLKSITQDWAGQPHTWATFGWTSTVTMHPSVSGVVGTHDGETPPMLREVTLPDDSRYTFDYTDNGQVNLIKRYAPAADTSPRSTTAYLYNGTDDCPRLTAQRVSANNWTGVNGLPSFVETLFGIEGDKHTLSVVGDPNGTIYKESYGTGWKRGLTTMSEVWAGGASQKTTTTSWEQDNPDPNATDRSNPRVNETNIYDSAGNRRRETINYTSYGLPSEVREWIGPNADSLYRLTVTGYRFDGLFVNLRLIGLVDNVLVIDGATAARLSKITYDYDSNNIDPQATSATQHDQSYSASFLTRGNVTRVSRWDVTDLDNPDKALRTQISYDAAGSVLSQTDPAGHHVSFAYADVFSDGHNDRGTFAYPTIITDADSHNSYTQYNYDFGAVTGSEGPPVNGQTQGLIKSFSYDEARRVRRVTTVNTGAYTEYGYGPYYTETLSSVNSPGDAYAIQLFDGAGRVWFDAGEHPGSDGHYRAVYTQYDSLGRVFKQSNPTEITSDGAPTGDDAAGWIFTQQSYDWKGRPLETTHLTDSTKKYASYDGCGCAGGERVTLTDERGRQQKVYHDPLGRIAKTEIMNWDQTTVYSTTANVYNSRDQVTLVRQYQGNDQSGGYQDTTMSYDGYGRLKTKHLPEQQADPNNSASTDHSTWAYNPDDTVLSVTDARGASATYSYNNNRRLVSHISYDPAAGGADTPDVSFGYDAVGNRISMTDGLGSKSYTYNQLSHLMSETRTITNVGTFPLTYDYNLAGELKKITDATNMTINYGFDNSGRLNGVTGSDSLYAGVSNYASNFQYRAWGGLKAMTDGTGHTSSLLYNSKLLPSHFQISGNTVTQDYDYYNDGRISVVHNTTDQNFDRSYSYDHAGRLLEAKSGRDVNGYQYGAVPYHETFGYDGFSNLTARQSQSWNGLTDDSDAATYSNNRRSGWGYDADGRNTTIDTRTNTFDAAGRQTLMVAQQVLWNGNHISVNQTSGYDGDGARIQDVSSSVTTYYLRSSVLGGAIIEELNNSGQKNAGYVCLPGGELLATQTPGSVTWKHNTPAGTTEYTANSYNNATGRTEFDPLGANLSLSAPPDPPPSEGPGDVGVGHFGGIMDQRWSDFFNLESGFTVNGFSISSSEAMFYLNFGTGNKGLNSVSASGVATALGVKFAHAGASKVAFGSPGVEGTPGHQTLEWGWTKLGETGPLVYTLVATTYSGTSAIPGSIVTLASSIQASPTQASAFRAREENAVGEAYRLLERSDCVDFMRALVRQAAKVTGQLNSITLSLGGGSSMTAYNFNSFTGLQAYQAAIDNGWVRSLTERPGYTMTEGAEGETLRHTQKGSFGDIIGEIAMHEVTWRNSFYGATLTEAGQKTLHESLHQLPGFTDQLLANAARYAAGQAQEAYGDSDSERLRASRDLTDRINQHCR